MSHLSSEQRYTIGTMYARGMSQKIISETIGRDKSVVSRELSRNRDLRSKIYKPDLAQRKCNERHRKKAKKIKLDEPMKQLIDEQLGKKFSPEQIVGLAKTKGVSCVSHERIYQYIWADKKAGGTLSSHLRRIGKKYRKRGENKDKRGEIKGRISIKERPEIVEAKTRLGDLEIDTIIGKDHKGAILTINDRVTGMVKIAKLNGKDAEELAKKSIETLADWKCFLQTITSDNGKEFAAHSKISEALEVQYFFADPYKSWQRGANENLNGLIRQYIPKKTNFDDVSDDFIKKIEDDLNNRPRKRLDFESPKQRLDKLLVKQYS